MSELFVKIGVSLLIGGFGLAAFGTILLVIGHIIGDVF